MGSWEIIRKGSNMLEELTINGFKSIKELNKFKLEPINVLIGANGSGKSNFIDFFRMLRAMLELDIAELEKPSLAAFIENKGGMENLLYNGPKQTNKIHTELMFNNATNGYRFDLRMAASSGFLINNEACFYKDSAYPWWELGSGVTRPFLLSKKSSPRPTRYDYIYNAIQSWQIYHFHDTSQFANVRLPSKVYDCKYFHFDAANLAAFLYTLKSGTYNLFAQKDSSGDNINQDALDAYENIVETIKIIAPYFEDFILEPYQAGPEEKIKLQWKQKGSSLPMQSYHLSDGTLRFICMATALLQPQPPELILIDEPELGLHPEALNILAGMIDLAKDHTQFILSTQSPAFADLFMPENIITVKRRNGATTFERLTPEILKGWIDEYSVGQLWRKNVIKGGIINE